MAQSNQTTSPWNAAAIRCGYAVHNGLPVIGVSGDDGDGFIVPVPMPAHFTHITDSGVADNVFRAVAAHALRVGQGAVKASKTPTREIAEAAVASAVNGTYKPKRDVSSDILAAEADRMFEQHVRARVLAVKADADDASITATVKAQADTGRGKELLAEFRAKVAEAGTYTPRRGKGGTASAIVVAL